MQNTLFYFRSKYDTKKMHVGVEVKHVSAGGTMWKGMVAEQYEPPLKAEDEEEEEVVDMEPGLGEANSGEPEQDWDDVYHKHREELLQYLAPLRADYQADAAVRIFYSEPEKDEDEVYHRDNQYSGVQTESDQEIGEDKAARVHLQPEEDKDDLYHRGVEHLLFHSDPKDAAPVDVPSQRKHSKPEEDRDDLHHQWSHTHKPTWAAPRNPKIKQAKSRQQKEANKLDGPLFDFIIKHLNSRSMNECFIFK